MEGQNIINTFFFTAVDTGNSITLNIPNKKPKYIKIQFVASNTTLTGIPVYFDFMGHKIFTQEIIGVNNNPFSLIYEFSNDNYVNENHLLFIKNANTEAKLNFGNMIIVFNFIY